jgi:hypothetical protein
MSTIHTDEDFNGYREKDRERRKKITNHNPDLAEAPLQIPNPIDEYNKRMGYIDQHSQLISYYSVQQSHFRVWWPIFFFLLDATLVNVWVLLRITGSTLLHRDMQIDLAYDLIKEGLQELANDPLQYPRTQQFALRDLLEGTEHALVKETRRQCVMCREKGVRKNRRGRIRLKRKVLGEITNQGLTTHASKKGSQTWFACSACRVALCKKGECWTKYHSNYMYYGRMGKFSRFALVGGLVHQAITVPTHYYYYYSSSSISAFLRILSMYTHASLPFRMHSLRIEHVDAALTHSIDQVAQLFRRDGVPGFLYCLP